MKKTKKTFPTKIIIISIISLIIIVSIFFILKPSDFKAKIGEDIAFQANDIEEVCQTAECSGIYECNELEKQWVCAYSFRITLSTDSAEKIAEITNDLTIKGEYLSKNITFYSGNKIINELNIGSDMKGKVISEIQLSGFGVGKSEQEAGVNAISEMKKIQKTLIAENPDLSLVK